MGSVKLQTFYPQNNTVQAVEINNNNAALEGSLGASDINEQNVRNEGIDRRNLGENLTVAEIGRLNNGYQIGTGGTVAAGARYDSYSVDVNQPKELPINHDENGATNTAVSKGTKLRLNGTAGQEVAGNELVRINYNVTVYSNSPHTPVTDLVTALIDTNTKDGGTGATYPYGSGIGEWCWLIYPKVNVTSNALNDSDFVTVEQAGLVDGKQFLDPSAITGINSIANNFVDFQDRRWDHVTVIPSMFVSATNVATSPVIMINASNDLGGNDNDRLGGPQMFNGTFQFKVKDDVANGKRIYGVQLYVSGYWRMHGNTSGTGSPNNAGMFLEYEICDPSRTNTDGDPIPLYGIEGQLHLERIQTSVIIHKTMVA